MTPPFGECIYFSEVLIVPWLSKGKELAILQTKEACALISLKRNQQTGDNSTVDTRPQLLSSWNEKQVFCFDIKRQPNCKYPSCYFAVQRGPSSQGRKCQSSGGLVKNKTKIKLKINCGKLEEADYQYIKQPVDINNDSKSSQIMSS